MLIECFLGLWGIWGNGVPLSWSTSKQTGRQRSGRWWPKLHLCYWYRQRKETVYFCRQILFSRATSRVHKVLGKYFCWVPVYINNSTEKHITKFMSPCVILICQWKFRSNNEWRSPSMWKQTSGIGKTCSYPTLTMWQILNTWWMSTPS